MKQLVIRYVAFLRNLDANIAAAALLIMVLIPFIAVLLRPVQ